MNNLAIKDIESPIKVVNYMWKKSWVRPHESLWSVMRNFRNVNGHCEYGAALKLLGIGPILTPKQSLGIESRYGIYSRYTIKKAWEHLIDCKLLPSDYGKEISSFSRLISAVPIVVSDKLIYCPKCMEYGYHSYIHQLSNLTTCPFHEGQRLLIDYRETYVWGESRRVHYDHQDKEYMKRIAVNMMDTGVCNFDNKAMGRLPSEWKEPAHFRETIAKVRIYNDYEQIAIASSAARFTNSDINGGSFFLSHRKRVPEVSIFDVEASESSALDYLKSECEKMGFQLYDLDILFRRYRFASNEMKRIILLVFSRKLLNGLSTEEIRKIEGNLLTCGKISYKDRNSILVLFLWDYVGCRFLHHFISIRNMEDLMSEDLDHSFPKRYCGAQLLSVFFMRDCGTAVAMHIIKDHMESCYKAFRELLIYMSSRGKESFGLDHRLELFNVPTYITEKRAGAIYIYREI